jgi:hypothetical protein
MPFFVFSLEVISLNEIDSFSRPITAAPLRYGHIAIGVKPTVLVDDHKMEISFEITK